VEYLIPVFETALMVNEPCMSLDLLAIAAKDPAANSYLQPFLWFKGFPAVALQVCCGITRNTLVLVKPNSQQIPVISLVLDRVIPQQGASTCICLHVIVRGRECICALQNNMI
jgi:hypothetical protein